jgi:hypothetical protein
VMIVLIPHPLPGRKSDESSESDVIVFSANCLLLAGSIECEPLLLTSSLNSCFQGSGERDASAKRRRSQLASFGIPNRSHVGRSRNARTIIPAVPRC